MKKIPGLFILTAVLFSCNSESKEKGEAAVPVETTAKAAMDMPYKPSYSATWTQNISDADLHTVLTTYKDWADGNISGLSTAMADTVTVEMNSGDHLVKSNADLMTMWKTYRDSLSSVTIEMQGWNKMYEPEKKDAYIVTWYKETDVYKNGKVDSAYYHDINQVKNGKISWYSQYKRPAK
jgi:ketosteroid isomerase-like protein